MLHLVHSASSSAEASRPAEATRTRTPGVLGLVLPEQLPVADDFAPSPEVQPSARAGKHTIQREAAWCAKCQGVTDHTRLAYESGLHTDWACPACEAR